MNRKERRAHKFGHFSPNRIWHLPVDKYQGLEKEMFLAEREYVLEVDTDSSRDDFWEVFYLP